ncbi:MAG: MFS transporter [Defluviitaleaceae bacterium]|nr:MFS transporter [Defluviitaleaceae bacterium]
MDLNKQTRQRAFFYLLIATVLTSLAAGLSEATYSNFYLEVYNVTAAQRGFIEFPRELPGLIAVIVVSVMSFLGEIRLAIVAQLLSITGLLLLGIFTPPFAIMLGFLFINSMGMHLYMPLKDGIGLNIIGDENTGRKFGLLNGVRTGAGFFAALAVFFGFRTGFFDFSHYILRNFLIATLFIAGVVLILLKIRKMIGDPPISTGKGRFLFRKEYKFYYLLASLHGAHKQIAGVFGPWVLISILLRQADTMAFLSMIGMFLGIFFIPMAGRLADRFGVRSMMFAEGFSFIGIYVLFGVFSAGLMSGSIGAIGIPIIAVYVLFILDRMTMQLGMIRVLYLRSIVRDRSEISPTLSTGMSIDHAISIICAFLGGLVWEAWGPQYVFFIAAVLALGNVMVAVWLPRKGDVGIEEGL